MGQGGDSLTEGLTNGLLLFRDQTVNRMSRADAEVTLGLFAGRKQVEVSADVGVSQSRVSDVSRKKGAALLINCQRLLEEGTSLPDHPQSIFSSWC